jgi:hypothetical protein
VSISLNLGESGADDMNNLDREKIQDGGRGCDIKRGRRENK